MTPTLSQFYAQRGRMAASLAVAMVALTATHVPAFASVFDVNTPPQVSQQAYLKTSNNGGTDVLRAVAISGDTIVVGARFEDGSSTGANGPDNDLSSDSGAAYVYTRTAGVWTQQAYLKASNTGQLDEFGGAVAIDGDTIVIGATEEDSDAVSVDGDQTNENAAASGAAYVFTRSGGTWTQQAYLKSSNSESADRFGSSVAVDGDTILVGAPMENGGIGGVNVNESDNTKNDAGAVYVFARNAGEWSEQAYVKASNPDISDHFGSALDIDGDTIIVGAKDEDSTAMVIDGDQSINTASGAGAAYVFTRSGVNWSQQAYLKPSNAEANDAFGTAVSVSGNTIAVGANGEDSNATGVNGFQGNLAGTDQSGAAYVFFRSGSTWSQQAYIKASNTGLGDSFGLSLAVDGDVLVVGAPTEDGRSRGINRNQLTDAFDDAGAAYRFTRTGTSWFDGDYLKASNTDPADNFGIVVAASDGTIVASAQIEQSLATGVDGDEEDNSGFGAGAAYVYASPCTSAPFNDVATSHPFCTDIEWMEGSSISNGFGDGTYRPNLGVTRQAMSAFMARFAEATTTPCASQPFTDVPTSNQFCGQIQWMKDQGISTGFGDGTFRPSTIVTRQAMSAFMSRLAGAAPTPCVTPPFPDVPVEHPFCKEIRWMKDQGISTGFGDGTYKPGLPVTRQAMSAFIYRLNNFLYHR
jgi:hypothetical protein